VKIGLIEVEIIGLPTEIVKKNFLNKQIRNTGKNTSPALAAA